jgi:hypothetical protein
MLVILSPASVASTNVMDEVSFALEEKRTVIPVLYRDCKIPFRLRRLQHIDCRSDYNRGLSEILAILVDEQADVLKQPAAPDSAAPLQALGAEAAEMQQSERAAAEVLRKAGLEKQERAAADARRAELERQERAAAEARRRAELEMQERAAEALKRAQQERAAAAQREAPPPQAPYEFVPDRPSSSMKRYVVAGVCGAVAIAIGIWILVGGPFSQTTARPERERQTPAPTDLNQTNQTPSPPQTKKPPGERPAKPSFACTGIPRTRPIETLLCQDAKLADAEVAMVAAYDNALAALSEEDKTALKADQTAWLKQFTKVCTALAPGDDIAAPGFRDCVERYETGRARDLKSWKPKAVEPGETRRARQKN